MEQMSCHVVLVLILFASSLCVFLVDIAAQQFGFCAGDSLSVSVQDGLQFFRLVLDLCIRKKGTCCGGGGGGDHGKMLYKEKKFRRFFRS